VRGWLLLLALALASCASPARTVLPPERAPGTTPVMAALPTAVPGQETILLATTTSVQDSGLLDALLPVF